MPDFEADFDEIAALMPRVHALSRTDKWILRNLPRSRGRALEIGCGTGELARQLAREFASVDAIDASRGMIDEALRRGGTVTFARADLFDWLAAHRGQYDCIVTVATLHHVDLAAALRAMRDALAPGGCMLVVDLYDRSSLAHLPVNVVAAVLGGFGEVLALLRGRSSLRLRAAYRRHGRGDRYETLETIRATAAAIVRGANVKGTLFWRYTLRWCR